MESLAPMSKALFIVLLYIRDELSYATWCLLSREVRGVRAINFTDCSFFDKLSVLQYIDYEAFYVVEIFVGQLVSVVIFNFCQSV